MATENKTKYTIVMDVDAKAAEAKLNSLTGSIKALANMPANDVLKRYKIDEKSLGESQAKLHQLRQAIQNSFNPSTGQIEFNKLINEQKINLKDLSQEMLRYGAEGQSAFLNLANSAINLNEHFKHSFAWLNKIGTTFMNTIRWQISTRVVQGFTGAISNAYSYAKSLDSSLNDIRIVTGKSADEMERFAKTANTAAKELGTATTEYTNASLIYYQQGLGNAEVAKRAETTVKVSNVTGMSAKDTSDALTALWNGFKVSLDETELYVDKLAAVAASSASDLEELTTAMSKVAATANTVGVDIDQLTAQISTIVSVTRQAPESVGTALKTIYARIGDLKIDGADEDGVALGQVSSQMEELGIQILDTNGDMREMGTILEDVAEKWNKWTTAQKQAAAIAMAGKRQYTMLMSLFEGWEMYSKEVQIAANAQGTLQRQQDIYLDSMEAHLQQFETAKEALKGEFVDSGTVNNVVDIFTKLTESITKFIQNIGGGKKVLWDLVAALSALSSNAIGSGIAKVFENFSGNKFNKIEMEAKANAIEQMKQAIVEVNDKGAISKVFADSVNTVFKNIDDATAIIKRGNINQETVNKMQEIIQQQIDKVNELGKAAERTELALEKALGGDEGIIGEYIQKGSAGLDIDTLQEKGITFSEEQTDEMLNYGYSVDKVREEIEKFHLEGKNAEQMLATLGQNSNSYLGQVLQALQSWDEETKKVVEELNNADKSVDELVEDYLKLNQVQSGQIDQVYTERVEGNYEKYQEILKLSKDIQNNRSISQDRYKDNITGQIEIGQIGKGGEKGNIWRSNAQYQKDLAYLNELAARKTGLSEKFSGVLSGEVRDFDKFKQAFEAITKETGGMVDKEAKKAEEAVKRSVSDATKSAGSSMDNFNSAVQNGMKENELASTGFFDRFKAALKSIELEQKIQGVTTFASSLLMINRGISSISSAISNLSDVTKSASERTSAFLQSMLSTLVMMGPAIARIFKLVREGTLTTPWLAAITAALIAISAIIYGITEALGKEERELQNLKQTVTDLKASQDELNQSISSMKSEWESINSSRDALDDMIKGTDEWKQKVSELNEQVIKLATTYPELLAGLKKNADGVYSIDENTYNKFLENQTKQAQRLSIAGLIAQNSVYEYENTHQEITLTVNNDELQTAILKAEQAQEQNNLLIEQNTSIIGDQIASLNAVSDGLQNLQGQVTTEYYKEHADEIDAKILATYGISNVDVLTEGFEAGDLDNSETLDLIKALQRNDIIKSYVGSGERYQITDASGKTVTGEGLELLGYLREYFELAKEKIIEEEAGTAGKEATEAFQQILHSTINNKELEDAFVSMIEGGDITEEQYQRISNLSSNQIKKLQEAYDNLDLENAIDVSSSIREYKTHLTEITTKANKDFFEGLTDEKGQESGLPVLKKSIQSTLEKAITGDISDTEFTTLTDTLNELVTEFPELIKYQEILNNKSLKGTEEWIQNLYKLQEDLNKEQLNYWIGKSSDIITNEFRDTSQQKAAVHTIYNAPTTGYLSNSFDRYAEIKQRFGQQPITDEIRQKLIDEIFQGGSEELLEGVSDLSQVDELISSSKLHFKNESTVNTSSTTTSDITYQINEVAKLKQTLDDLANTEYNIDLIIHSNAEDEFNNIEKSIDSMTDMAEKIGENFVVNAEDLRELNQAFPGIIQDMEILEDGTVQLNEEAAQGAMDAAAAQITSSNEATIAQLQDQATLLRAKQASYRNIAEEAKLAAENESYEAEAVSKIKSELAQVDANNQAAITEKTVENADIETKTFAANWSSAYQSAATDAAAFGDIAYNAYVAGTGNEEAHEYLKTALANQNWGATYEGYDPGSSEAAQITTYDATSSETYQEYWKRIEETYRKLAEQAGYEANDIEGMIAEAKASGYAALFGLGSVRSGKGFGTGSATKDELDDEIDKYKTINEELELYSKNLSLISNLKEKAYGKEYIKLLNQEADIYSNQVETLKQKGEMLAEDAGARRNTLAANGFIFDEQGNILNYYERLSELYNAGSDSYEQLKEIADEYFDYLNDCYDNLEEQFEAEDKHHQALIDSLKQEIELVQELNDYQNDYADFIIKIAEDDEYLKRAQEYGIKLTADFNALKEYEARAQKLLAEHDKMLKEGSSDIYGDDLKQLREDIEENQKALEDFIISMADSYESAMDEYLALIDATANAFKEEVKILEHAIKEIQHYAKIQKAVLGESDMATVVALDQAQLTTQNKITENYRKEADFWRQQMDRTVDKTSEAYKKMKENYETAIDSMESSMEEAIAAATQKAADALKQIQLEFESAITEGSTFGRVSNEWEMQKKIEKDSYDAANRAFKLAELRYNYTKAAEEASAEGQARINKLMEEQLSMLYEKDKLTQYDVERAQKLLDIELARIALEEAQNNKNQMRLKRDAAGNYTYQYVADQGAIDDAQQKYDAARNSLYNFDKNAYQSTTTEILSRLQEAEKKFADIRSDSSLSAEAREEELNKWYEYYQEYVANRTEEIEGIRVNLEEDAQIEWENYYKDSLDRAYTNGKEMMDKTVAGYTLAGKSVIEITTLDADRINTELTHLKDHTIENLHEWLANVDEATEIARYDYENLIPAIEELNEETLTSVAYASAYTDTLTAAMGPMGDYIDELGAIKKAYEGVKGAAEALADQEQWLLENQQTIETNLDTLLTKIGSLIDDTNRYINLSTGGEDSGTGSGGSPDTNDGNENTSSELAVNKNPLAGKPGIPTDMDLSYRYQFGIYYDTANRKKHIILIDYNDNTMLTSEITGKNSWSNEIIANQFQEKHPLINPVMAILDKNEFSKYFTAQKKVSWFNTGGYTGEWGLDGRMAVLHQKELVLNAKDTENMLKMLDITRKAFENATVRGILANSFATPSNNVTSNEQIGTTYMTINATFPNVNKAIEIEEAFKNLKNYASQQAHMQVYQNGINNFSKTFI